VVINVKTETMKITNKEKTHIVASVLLLLPATLYLEMSDGKFNNESIATLFLTEWFGGIVAATILAVISWGVYYLIKKESSIIKAFYKSCYFISFISVGSNALGFFLGKF